MNREIRMNARIEELRKLMHDMIDREGNLLHSKVIEVSQELDKYLNEYNKTVNYSNFK